jgi:hypothetical protein
LTRNFSYVKGSFRHLPKLKMKTQKSQPQGVPRGWQMVAEADRLHQRDSIIGQALSAARRSSLSTCLHTAATGHAYTRGEGVILCYAPNKTA